MTHRSDTENAIAKAHNSRYRASMTLFERGQRVVPGGIYGHVTPALLEPGDSPYYAAHAQGARYWDVDGNEFLDFMCGYGPVILGHCHPEVEAAVDEARSRGTCFNHPTEHMVELAETLTELIDFAQWSVFGKNGSDMTTWCTQVAREHTGRQKILMAEAAYHGSAPWCTPGHAGLTDEDRAHIVTFKWNDPQSVEDAFKACADDVAALVMTPFHHPLFVGSTMPEPAFLDSIHRACQRAECLLILDDIRAGFRLSLEGSHRVVGLEPDLACYSKAMGNGYPISAAVGRSDLKVAASKLG
ncbi:MAG: aminotransferase class III-fold pyridoxal phosphate-dependent enzyme [Myxococcota bacterium]